MNSEIEMLRLALNVTLAYHTPYLPGDSRAVPDWFVACTAVACDIADPDGRTKRCLEESLEAAADEAAACETVQQQAVDILTIQVEPERKTLDELAEELWDASQRYHGAAIQHVKSGSDYRIVGVHHRESDMAICIEYTPIRSTFHNRVKFARSIEEMDFGNRFIFAGGLVG